MIEMIFDYLKVAWKHLRSEDGFVGPSDLAPEPVDDSPEDGNDDAPEDQEPDDDPKDGQDSTEYVKKLREENKKKTQRAQKAEKERDEYKRQLDKIRESAGLKPEDPPEDVDAKIKTSEQKVRKAALYTEFVREAARAGMSDDSIAIAFNGSDLSELEVDIETMAVTGMDTFMKDFKAQHPSFFVKKAPEDVGDVPNPPKGDPEQVQKEIEIMAQRQHISVEAAMKMHKDRVERAKAAGQPTDFDTLWGIRRDYKGNII